jgi:hypothetical protein
MSKLQPAIHDPGTMLPSCDAHTSRFAVKGVDDHGTTRAVGEERVSSATSLSTTSVTWQVVCLTGD